LSAIGSGGATSLSTVLCSRGQLSRSWRLTSLHILVIVMVAHALYPISPNWRQTCTSLKSGRISESPWKTRALASDQFDGRWKEDDRLTTVEYHWRHTTDSLIAMAWNMYKPVRSGSGIVWTEGSLTLIILPSRLYFIEILSNVDLSRIRASSFGGTSWPEQITKLKTEALSVRGLFLVFVKPKMVIFVEIMLNLQYHKSFVKQTLAGVFQSANPSNVDDASSLGLTRANISILQSW
jgi:hypothetical protein